MNHNLYCQTVEEVKDCFGPLLPLEAHSHCIPCIACMLKETTAPCYMHAVYVIEILSMSCLYRF